MKLLIAGSRDIQNYLNESKFEELCDKYLQETHYEELTIVSGGARGVDTWAKNYATTKSIDFIEMPAKWRDEKGNFVKSAGMRRNAEMLKVVDTCLFFWDGKSPGTKQCIGLAEKQEKVVKTIRLDLPL